MTKKKLPPGITENKRAGGTFSYTADIDIKGFPRLKKTFPTEELAVFWRTENIQTMHKKAEGMYVPPEGTVGELVAKYIKEYSEVNGGWSRSKQDNLDKIIEQRGEVRLQDWNKRTTIDYGRQLATTRGPVGVAERLNALSRIFKLAGSAWDINAPVEQFKQGMAVLRELGLVGTTEPRDRQIEAHEIAQIKQHLPTLAQDVVDTLNILPFRVSETCAIEWPHFDQVNRAVTLYRKNTSKKKKAYRLKQQVTLPVIEVVRNGKVVEIDTFDLLFKRDPQRKLRGPFDLCPHLKMEEQGHEVSRMFSVAHKIAGIEDIHLHDCRAESMGNLFAQGFDVAIVCHLSGHRDWKVVQAHYARLKPRKLHELFKMQAHKNRQARVSMAHKAIIADQLMQQMSA